MPRRLSSGAAAGAKVQVSLKDKTTQIIGDRGIAHAITGGVKPASLASTAERSLDFMNQLQN